MSVRFSILDILSLANAFAREKPVAAHIIYDKKKLQPAQPHPPQGTLSIHME